VHQQGRIEAPERLIAELLLKNEKLRMAAILTAHEEDPSNNSGVMLTNAPTASKLCKPGGGRTMPNRSRDILISLRHTPVPIFSAVGDLVRPAVDGIPALNEITQRVPDVAISDLNMPGISDVEFLSIVGDCSLISS